MSRSSLAPGYIAYVDEAGDDGLQTIRSANVKGASEWLVLSAVLIKSERERTVTEWLRDMISGLNQHQINHIHFHRLSDDRKLRLCDHMSQLPIRIFTVISHKKNMEKYKNLRASQARVNRTAWFYAWMTRILLERLSRYCAQRSIKDYGEYRPLRLEISQRGGVNLNDIISYIDLLKKQEEMGMLYLNQDKISWNVIDTKLFRSFPNKERAGLQLADIAASAFYAGLEFTHDRIVKPNFAKCLSRVVTRNQYGKYWEMGVKVMPSWIDKRLPSHQAELIKYYRNR